MDRTEPVVLVKIGGSLITDKTTVERFRPRRMIRVARELAEARSSRTGRIVLGHGAGSFGHAAAREHGVGSGPLEAEAVHGIAAVQDRTARLHRLVIDALLRTGLPTYSLAPSSLAVASRGTVGRIAVDSLVQALDGGMVPVLFGDVVMDRAWRASICSTESAFLAIARALRARGIPVSRALWVGTTAGVLDDRGRVIRKVFADERADRALRHAGGSEGTDVTGGMNLRVRAAIALARRGVPSWIGDGTVPGRVRDALAGRRVTGTEVVPVL